MSATVLVIEDYSAHRQLLGNVVASMGCRSIEAADGRTGLELAQQHDPTLIVLDLILPDIDGVEVLRRLRREPATQNTPILIVTAVDSEERVVEALEAGADEYVTKPFDRSVLAARMKVLLRGARLQCELEKRAEQAEAIARMARAAALEGELATVCGEVAETLGGQCGATVAELHLLRDDRVIGPFGGRRRERVDYGLETLLNRGELGRVICGEVPWQRVNRDALGPLSPADEVDELAVVPVRHGRQVLALLVLGGDAGTLREGRLRRVGELVDAAALAVAAALARGERSENEIRYRLLFDQAGDGVALLDSATGSCREANQTLSGWLSAVPSALVGRPFAALFEPETAGSLRQAIEAASHGQRVTLSDVRLVDGTPDGREVEVVLRRVRHDVGGALVAVVRDLASRQATQRYEKTHGDLTRLARTVRALNHEINNPLTCIIGLTQLLQLRLQEMPEHLPQLDRILESAEQITALSKHLRETAIQLGGDEPIEAVEALLDELSSAGNG